MNETNKLKTPSNIVDFSCPTANMYGCQPCPKCKSDKRWSQNDPISHIIICDDCGFSEPVNERLTIEVKLE